MTSQPPGDATPVAEAELSNPPVAMPVDSAAEAAIAPPIVGQPRLNTRAGTVAASHAAVDFLSVVLLPLLPVIEGRVHLAPEQGAYLIGVGSIASGLIQPMAAWFTDRFDTRILGPLGILAAAIAYGLLAQADSFIDLLILQTVAMGGIGAFHPVGAAAMGQLTAARRSLGVSIFFVAGMVGHFSGSLLVPRIVEWFDLRSLLWMVLPAVLAAFGLWSATGNFSHRHDHSHPTVRAFTTAELRRRWAALAILFLGNMMRFTVNMALLYLVVRWCESELIATSDLATLTPEMRSTASAHAGEYMGAIIVGMAIGGLTAGSLVRSGNEKWPIVFVGVFGAPFIMLLPHSSGVISYVVAAVCGIGFATSVPLTIAVGQRLLPHRTSLASGIMLGGAWTFAAAGPRLAQAVIDHLSLAWSFAFFGGLLLTAGALTIFLPSRLLAESARQA